MNKINKLVTNTFPENADEWLADEFQKKLKKLFKPKKDKTANIEPKKQSSYIKFCVAERPGVKEEYPNLTVKEITAKLGDKWNKYKIENPEYLEKYGYTPKV